jgi:microsomal dipeptidase-like Zn-dependent dipeptidase
MEKPMEDSKSLNAMQKSGLKPILWAAFLFAFALAIPVTAAAGPCGSNGERACCNGGFEFCNSRECCDGESYSTSRGCNDPNGCSCGPIPSESSLGMCYRPTPCGDDGQRACCNGDGEFAPGSGACNVGLVQNFGTCGPDNPAACICGGLSLNSIFPAEYSLGTCVRPTPCGGPGQRACCNGAGEFAPNGLACDTGTVQIPGTCGPDNPAACICGGPNPFGLFASGICVATTPCGGKGQRACCVGFLEYSSSGWTCNSGLIQVPGCSGDCTCGGPTSIGEPDGNSCTTIEAISEPATNANPAANETGPTWTLPKAPLPTGPECPSTGLCGYADLHVHMFGNLGHGGAMIAGEPWDPRGVNAALAEDYGSNLPLVNQHGTPKPGVGAATDIPHCPDFLLNAGLCKDQVLFHGDHTLFDTATGGGTNDGAASNMGVPLFNGWPLWTSTIHQQVYYKWLERAWLGGLRLMVMHAVTNEALCKSGTKIAGTDCSLSMTAIDAELQAVHTFQNWLDIQYGGPGKGWFQIVTSPKQAESVIRDGKLAVVLGIEVDNLFNCHRTNADGNPANGEGPVCTDTYVQQQLQKYYGMGVRHIFPIHNFDNAFGTPAAWQDAINVGNIVAEGNWWDVINCKDPGYGFYLDALTDAAIYLLGFGGVSAPPYPSVFPSGSCHNSPGLTNLGAHLVEQAMNLGMIIDVDHMSIDALNDTIDLANQRSPVYAGIAATHVQFFDLYHQKYSGNYGRHERMRTYDQLQRIKKAGGMISAMLKDDTQDTGKGWCLPQGNCPFGAPSLPTSAFTYNYNGSNAPSNNNGALQQNCSYSTTEWAQAYLYGVQAMGGAPVAMGSDFNGIAGHVGPRFGNGACAGNPAQRVLQERAHNRLAYPFTIPGFGTFDREVSGQKVYDFNVDGLAHIGLLPDMVADLKNIGVTDEQLKPLFGSAQGYVNMWAAVYHAPAPDVSLSGVPATAPYGSSFTVKTDNHGTTTSVPTITADPSNVCSISGSVVTMKSGTGTCSVTATWAADDNYAKATITEMANATKVPLTVTANDVTITFGQAIPTFTASYSGFVNNENQSVLSGSPSLTTTATACSPAGSYTITAELGTLASANYSFAAFKNGTLTIVAGGKVTPKVDLSVNGSTSSTVSVGDTVTFMARVHAAACYPPPNGSITISESTNGDIRFGSSPLSKDPNSNDGLATIKNSSIPVGSYTLVGTYGGDNDGKYYNGAQSNTVSLEVKAKPGGPK